MFSAGCGGFYSRDARSSPRSRERGEKRGMAADAARRQLHQAVISEECAVERCRGAKPLSRNRPVHARACWRRSFPCAHSGIEPLEFQQQPGRVLHGVLDRGQELYGLTTIDYAMVI